MNLDIGKAFTFFTDDPRWVAKLAIGGGLAIAWVLAFFTIVGWIPIGLILTGYLVQLARNVIMGSPTPLPEWEHWGERMIDGFKAWLIAFVYSLPATIIAAAFSFPAILSSIRDSARGVNSSGATAAATGLSYGGSCLAWIVGIIVGLFVPIAIGRYAATSNFGEAFQFGAIFNTLRQHFVTYLIITLLGGIVLSIITGLGFIAICIGVGFTWFYSQLVLYHLYGQAQRQAQGNVPSGYGQPPMYGEPRPF